MKGSKKNRNVVKLEMEERVYQWAQALCSCAGEGRAFLEEFCEALMN